jgi:hypothetical protein
MHAARGCSWPGSHLPCLFGEELDVWNLTCTHESGLNLHSRLRTDNLMAILDDRSLGNHVNAVWKTGLKTTVLASDRVIE